MFLLIVSHVSIIIRIRRVGRSSYKHNNTINGGIDGRAKCRTRHNAFLEWSEMWADFLSNREDELKAWSLLFSII